MARKLRLEFPGAIYHVINRGNYRSWIFQSARTKAAFEACLFEACRKSAWRLHAFVVMNNHYHLALETPEGNLVAGMQWLQATFANRFNRLRNERGHLFQSRYKSLLVEAGAPLGQVCHYIHLNPVRAALASVPDLNQYRYSSYWYLRHPAARPEFLMVTTALNEAGGLSDTSAGHRNYAAYLAWQAADGPAGKSKAYVNLSRGWVLGSKQFKAALIADGNLPAESRAWEASGAAEIREARWTHSLRRALGVLGRTEPELQAAAKSARWKLALARWLKTHTQARTRWMANALALGAPSAVSRNLASFRRNAQAADPTWKKLKSLSST